MPLSYSKEKENERIIEARASDMLSDGADGVYSIRKIHHHSPDLMSFVGHN